MRAFGAVDVVRLVADGIGAVVVLEGEVEVPDGFHVELRVVAVLVHVGAPVCVGVARQFPHEEVPVEAGQVEVLTIPLLVVLPVRLVEGALEGVVVLTDVVELYRQDVLVVGVFDGDGRGTCRSEVLGLLRGIGVNLDEVAARQQVAFRAGVVHLVDVHAVFAYVDGVAHLIATLVLAVHDDVHRSAPRRVAKTHATAYLEGQTVAQQGLVAIVVDERPLLGLGRRVERTLLLVELDAVGLLGVRHRVVAAQSRRAVLLEDGLAVVRDDADVRLQFIDFVNGVVAREGVYDHRRQVRHLIELTVGACREDAPELQLRHHAAGTVCTLVADVAEGT